MSPSRARSRQKDLDPPVHDADRVHLDRLVSTPLEHLASAEVELGPMQRLEDTTVANPLVVTTRSS